MSWLLGLSISAGLIVAFTLLVRHVQSEYNWQEYAVSDKDA